MQILVQKFGGTSVKNTQTRDQVIHHIKEALKQNYKVVVVASAIGRKPDPYATDTLLSLVNFPRNYASSREVDLLMSCGETISSVVLSNELQKMGLSAVALTGAQAGLITTDKYTQANIKYVETNRILDEFKRNDVVVVAGFQGKNETGEITTIGRGGSDTTAVALGVTLQAKYIEIFTDVTGIMTADPKVVNSVKRLNVVSYNEICHLAYEGAKVVHPRAVEIAMQANIPMRVRSTYSNHEGTLVTSREAMKQSDSNERIITGIAHTSDITQIQVDLENGTTELSDIFKSMADANISIDFINISPNALTYTVAKSVTKKAVNILNELNIFPNIIEHCAKISAVGAGMAGVPGVASKIVMSLTEAGIQILQSADSHTTIWVLVYEKDFKTAVNVLHEAFNLHKIK